MDDQVRQELREMFNFLVDCDPRRAAETAFALAAEAKKRNEIEAVQDWAYECLELLGGLPCESMDDCAVSVPTIEGIPMPDFLHEGVVRERFQEMNIPLVLEL